MLSEFLSKFKKGEKKTKESLEDQFSRVSAELKQEQTEYNKNVQAFEEIKKQMEILALEITELEKAEQAKIEGKVAEATELIENENETIIENKLKETKNEPKRPPSETFKKFHEVVYNQKRKFLKFILLNAVTATSIVCSYHSPQEYWGMWKNWKERHIEKIDKDDPNIIGLDALYNDSTSVEKATYDFLGKEKINYKFGYYMTSVFDLSDKTPPRFKVINDKENYNQIDSAAGITTSLFNRFYKHSELELKLKGHTDKNGEEKADIPVIAYNLSTQTIKAGHYGEFNDDWLVSETYEIPLDFKLNKDGTINLMDHNQACRRVFLTTSEKGTQIPFPIGITRDKSIKTMDPHKAKTFGVLEGGKVIMVCGEKQLQVNGSFADMFCVYERLQKEYKGVPIKAYLLDNGSYNLPIWDKDNTLTPEEISQHQLRHYGGGTALVLVNDEKISPFEYKSKYKEFQYWTKNYTKDSVTGLPAKNEKSAIVLHHTGNYEDPSFVIDQFQDSVFENSAHVYIRKDGTRHLFNNDNYVMAHAGKSDFNNRNKVNYFSIGVELEGDSKDGQFTVAQLESLLEYLRPRVEKYNIPIENITTHKIIRDNYIKKHPKEKNIPTKRDLEDKVWKEIQNLIQKKLYQNKKTELSENANKMLGSITFQEAYRKTKNKDYAKKETKAILMAYDVPNEEISKTIYWVGNTV